MPSILCGSCVTSERSDLAAHGTLNKIPTLLHCATEGEMSTPSSCRKGYKFEVFALMAYTKLNGSLREHPFCKVFPCRQTVEVCQRCYKKKAIRCLLQRTLLRSWRSRRMRSVLQKESCLITENISSQKWKYVLPFLTANLIRVQFQRVIFIRWLPRRTLP